MDKLKRILGTLAEPSSWAGIAIILSLLGLPAPVVAALAQLVNVAPSLIDLYAAVAAAVAAIALREKKGAGA